MLNNLSNYRTTLLRIRNELLDFVIIFENPKSEYMQTRKYTSWKKNRKFGDIKGGRCKLKCEDGIFNKLHSFKFKQPA